MGGATYLYNQVHFRMAEFMPPDGGRIRSLTEDCHRAGAEGE